MLPSSHAGNIRTGSMDNHSAHVGQGDDANLRLVRFFSICLGSLVFVYSLFSVRLFIVLGQFAPTDWLLIVLRGLLGAAALVVISYPAWLAQWLEPRISEMGRVFEGEFASAETREKIRLIVLVTMVSLLLELVMIRWRSSV